MSPNATSEIVNAVRKSVASGDAVETAFGLVWTASTLIADDDHIAKVYLARTMVKVALSLDPDVSLSTQ